MEHSPIMQKFQPLKHLHDEAFDMFRSELMMWVSENPRQIVVHILEYYVHRACIDTSCEI